MAPSRSSAAVFAAITTLFSLAKATHYDVKVGAGGQLKFDPETLYAQVGDTVTYHYFAKNHSVVQSTFAEPCKPQANGFFSGFVANPNQDVEAPTTFTIHVNDTKPIWAYCGQTNGDHCQKGMVHAINAPAEGANTFANYKTSSMNAQKPSSSPPDGLPVGGLRKLHIDVGFDGNLAFNPTNVGELPRTVVEFSFNPANHSIVQSTFDAPCQPLDGGFSAPFVPTKLGPSGVTFEITIVDTKPLWYYCAQPTKGHCQAGMVGSINAATEGEKTFEAFKELASKAPASTIQPGQPNIGVLKVNGTAVWKVNGAVFDPTTTGWDPDLVYQVPEPGYTYSPYMNAMAGGGVPENYGWTDGISDNATDYLQQMQYMDDFLVQVLFAGVSKLTQGEWKGQYPEAIVGTLSSLFAQSIIQRAAYIESLQHYKKPTVEGCKFEQNADDIESWLETSKTALTLSIATTMHIITQVTDQDHWMVAPLATALGAKSRMSAMFNMMQNHMASSAPREVSMPAELAIDYVRNHYVVAGSCGSDAEDFSKEAQFPALDVTSKQMQPGTGRLTEVTIALPEKKSDNMYVAWIGPWGGVKYSDVGADGKSTVPDGLSGTVWIVVTSARDLKANDISKSALTGMAPVWVTDPWAHDG